MRRGIFNLHSKLLAAIQPLTTVQALGHAAVRRQRVQGLDFGRCEEGVMAFHHQLPPPPPVDTQDPQLRVLTEHVGGASGVHMETLQGGSALGAAVSKGIAVFCKEEKQSTLCTLYKSTKLFKNTICIIDG